MFEHRRTAVVAVVCLAIGAVLAPSAADEAKRFVYQAPTVITQPGTYLVTRDLAGSTPIQVRADGVTLDLGGHTVSGVGGGAISLGSEAVHVTIRNGRVTSDTSYGIYYSTTLAALHVALERLEIANTGSHGLYFRNLAHLTLRDCLIRGVAGRGLEAWANTTFTVEIERTTIRDAGSDALFFYNLAGGTIRDNTISGFNLSEDAGNHAGIQINCFGCSADQPGLIVRGNSIQGGLAGAHGMWATTLADGYLLIDNSVVHNGGDGLSVHGNGWRVTGNVVQANAGNGIHVRGNRHLIEGNQIEGNGASGILFGSAGEHAYRDNMIRGNGSPVTGSANTDAGGNILP